MQAAVDAGADTEAELGRLKEQWVMKERMLRTLATRNCRECRHKIKELRGTLHAYVVQKRAAANKPMDILSCTSEGETYYYLPTCYN